MAFNKARVMESARRAADKGQVDKAIREYLKVVREDPKDVRVWLKIGDLYAKKGAKHDATDTYLKVARFYGEQGFNRKAVAVYKQILKLDPRLVEVNLKLAELYRDLGLLSEAMQHFERVAAFFHREGKTREALATVRQLVELDPENVATRIKLAELYSKEGEVEHAVAEFRYALDYLRRHNREDDFLKVGERLLWHRPDNIDLSRELSAMYLRHRDPRRALQKLQVCFKADARDIETLAMLAQAFQQLEQKDKTVSVLRELARVLTEDGQMSQAAEVHENILQYAPDDTESLAFVRRARGMSAPPIEEEEISEPTDRLSAEDLLVSQAGRVTGAFPLVGDQHQPEAAIERGDPMQAHLADLSPIAAISSSSEISIDDEVGFDEVGSISGEVHADEIIKILTESDVYVKYNLHQKAIDHLRRVFELDPGNIEAREQLKEILLSQGREAEAMAELLQLARQTAPSDPNAAEAYLREIVSIDASCAEAYELANHYRLRLAEPDVEVVSETPGAQISAAEGGEVMPVRDDMYSPLPGEHLAAGSPVPGPNPHAPEVLDEAELVLDDLEPAGPSALGSPVTGTHEIDLDELVEADPYELVDPMAEPAAEPAPAARHDVYAPLDEQHELYDAELHDPATGPVTQEIGDVDYELDGALVEALGDTRGDPTPTSSDVPLARELAAAPLDDPDALVSELDGFSGSVHDPLAFDDATSQLQAAPVHDPAVEHTDEVDELTSDAIELIDEPEELDVKALDEEETGVGTIDEPSFRADNTARHEPDVVDQSAGTSLEDDLDEADFFLSQGLLDEAREILDHLARRYPGHPLVNAKLDDLVALTGAGAHDFGEVGTATEEGDAGRHTAEMTATHSGIHGGGEDSRPQVMLEKPVADEDADTHYDLGLAYKEMGLYDEAIKSFEKVVAARGVQCYLMIGLCYRERGEHVEAIGRFKGGLYVDGVSEREKYSLYYEIGMSYEHLGDWGEALYYIEMVMKKDPTYRDVRDRVAKLRRQLASAGSSRDDTDAAIEQLPEPRGR
jgi:pilus assembly protein FimV